MRRPARPVAMLLAALTCGACTGCSGAASTASGPATANPTRPASGPSNATAPPSTNALLTSPADLPVPAGAQRAVVVAETDGDTLHLRGVGPGPVPQASTRVRVLLINAPEVFGEKQCYGPEAARRTAELLPIGTQVRVAGDVDPRDRYGRPLVHVWRPDGVNLGEELVAEGYARVLQIDPNRRYLDLFRRREREARSAHRGLWGACP